MTRGAVLCETTMVSDDQDSKKAELMAVGHETAVASVVAGATRGVTKGGENIIPVRWETGRNVPGSVAKASSLFQSLLWILDHVRTNSKQGKAVLNYSGGE